MKHVYGKRAIKVPTEFIIGVIVAVIFGVIILVGVVGPAAAAVSEKGYKDELCRMNAGFRGNLVTAKGVIPLWFCSTRAVKVKGSDWDVCDPDGKFGFEAQAKTDEYKARQACVAQQIYNLASRCYYEFGENAWNMDIDESGVNGCFKASVYNMPGSIGKDPLNAARGRAGSSNPPIFLRGNFGINAGGTYAICFSDRSNYKDGIIIAVGGCPGSAYATDDKEV